MNVHELRYCAFLLTRIKQLQVEKEAMSIILDSPKPHQGNQEWRNAVRRLRSDMVFQSSVEATFAPSFERLRAAMTSPEALETLETHEAKTAISRNHN